MKGDVSESVDLQSRQSFYKWTKLVITQCGQFNCRNVRPFNLKLNATYKIAFGQRARRESYRSHQNTPYSLISSTSLGCLAKNRALMPCLNSGRRTHSAL